MQEEPEYLNKKIDVQARRVGILLFLTKRLTDGQEETVFFVDKIDMWFLKQYEELYLLEKEIYNLKMMRPLKYMLYGFTIISIILIIYAIFK